MRIVMLEPYNGKGKKGDVINVDKYQGMALIHNKVAKLYIETAAKKPRRKKKTAVKTNIETR